MIELDKEKWEQLTTLERDVINYVNTHEKEIPNMSILDIAQETYSSAATVSRAIRKCGINGIAELRYTISSKIDSTVESATVNLIFQKFINECTKTIENIRVSTIIKLTGYIKEAKRIFVIARGTTALIAEDFILQLQLLGYSAFLLKDSEILKRTDLLFQENDLVIIFTIKNSTPELEVSARYAQGKKAKVATCCCLAKCGLYKYSDLVVLGHREKEDIIGEYAIASRLPLQIIARTIVEYLLL